MIFFDQGGRRIWMSSSEKILDQDKALKISLKALQAHTLHRTAVCSQFHSFFIDGRTSGSNRFRSRKCMKLSVTIVNIDFKLSRRQHIFLIIYDHF